MSFCIFSLNFSVQHSTLWSKIAWLHSCLCQIFVDFMSKWLLFCVFERDTFIKKSLLQQYLQNIFLNELKYMHLQLTPNNFMNWYKFFEQEEIRYILELCRWCLYWCILCRTIRLLKLHECTWEMKQKFAREEIFKCFVFIKLCK